jgi:PPP family 3-phenylpropionic acid transporter
MLQLFLFCYYVTVGISMPFFPPYLRQLGLDGREVSFMLSAAPVLHLGVPMLWGWLADRTQRPDVILRLITAGAFLALIPLLFVRRLPALFVVFAVHQAFAVAISGISDSLAVERARHGADYGRLRSWGSIGFVMTCVLVGPILKARGQAGPDLLVPLLMATGFGLATLAAFGLRGHGGREAPHLRDVAQLLRDRRFRLVVTMAAIHWACLAPYNSFFTIVLRDRGISSSVAGWAVAAGALAEIGIFYMYRYVRARLAPAPLLALSFAVTVVRWALVAVISSPLGQVLLQVLHGITYGLFWAASLQCLGDCVPQKIRATGQVLFNAGTFGLANLIGVLGSGLLYDSFGGTAAFQVAAVAELIPLALALTLGRHLAPAAVEQPAARATGIRR